METKKNSEMKEKTANTRKIITTIVVIIVFAALALSAQYLVNSIDIVELLKKLHGG